MVIARRAFQSVLFIGAFVSLMGVYGTWPFVGYPATAAVTATPQVTMNPFAMVMGQASCAGATCTPIDMGPTPDNFVVNGDWNQEPVATNTGNYCGTTAAPNCLTFKYIDQIKNSCLTAQTQQTLVDAGLPATMAPSSAPDGPENWFAHFYPGNPTPAPATTPERLVGNNGGASCASYYVAPTPFAGAATHPFQMNPDDAGFRTELTNVAFTAANYPQTQNATTAPNNIYEDTTGMLGSGITGGGSAGAPFATEYGCGFNGGNTCRIDQQGTGTATAGPYAVADDYDTAIGKFANAACGSPCLKITLNGASLEGGSTVNPSCTVFNGTNDCHDKSTTGYIDNTFEKVYAKVIQANTSNNISALDLESPIFDHSGAGWSGPSLLDATLNTWINFQADSNTKSVVLTDLEPGWGSQNTGLPGDTSVDVRTMSIAMEWMAPDYSGTKSSNDRIVPRRLPIGLTKTESISFFELFLVPFAPKQVASTYTMNQSRNTTIGGGCPSGGDSHGIIDLLVQCALGDAGGVYRIEYNQLWFNGHNYGPMAVLVNTSGTDTFTISSSWFQLQPESSYHYALALAGSEMESVAQGNIGGGVANFTTCTNVSYCATGNNTMAQNTTSSIPTTIPPHSAVILVTSNS